MTSLSTIRRRVWSIFGFLDHVGLYSYTYKINVSTLCTSRQSRANSCKPPFLNNGNPNLSSMIVATVIRWHEQGLTSCSRKIQLCRALLQVQAIPPRKKGKEEQHKCRLHQSTRNKVLSSDSFHFEFKYFEKLLFRVETFQRHFGWSIRIGSHWSKYVWIVFLCYFFIFF